MPLFHVYDIYFGVISMNKVRKKFHEVTLCRSYLFKHLLKVHFCCCLWVFLKRAKTFVMGVAFGRFSINKIF